ncbi:MAG: GNAT family N-acetyltransferase [Pseudomonadota bacterium]
MSIPKGYSVRLFQPGDEVFLSAITQSAILSIGPRKYSQEQVNAWAARHPSPARFVERAEAGARILVALANPELRVAYALLEKDSAGDVHLDMLYCDPQHTRLGLSEALLARAQACAHDYGAVRLYTEASELARGAFERAGFAIQHRRDFTIEHEGRAIAIHNYAMEKRLD